MEYTVKIHKRSKKLSLRIGKDGRPQVTIPAFTPKFIVKKFVAQNKHWIQKHQKIKKDALAEFLTNSSVTLFGERYKIKIVSTLDPSKVSLLDDIIQIAFHNSSRKKLHPSFNSSNPPVFFTKFLKNTATHYIIKRIVELAKKMDIKYKNIHFKEQSTRWGSCSSKGNLNFNWRLVHFPTKIIDYVIIHELAHREHMNHSDKFWELVEKHDPEFRLNKRWLKETGSKIG